MNRYRKLEVEHAIAAHECEQDGRFRTITQVNYEMANYYADKADALDAKKDGDNE